MYETGLFPWDIEMTGVTHRVSVFIFYIFVFLVHIRGNQTNMMFPEYHNRCRYTTPVSLRKWIINKSFVCWEFVKKIIFLKKYYKKYPYSARALHVQLCSEFTTLVYVHHGITVNKWEIHEWDGWVHDPVTMVTPLTPKPTKPTRKAEALKQLSNQSIPKKILISSGIYFYIYFT
jgi:hypothetical protein